jgi:hypothetical protein
MKKIFLIFVIISSFIITIHSHEMLQFEEIREKTKNSSDKEIKEYCKLLINTKIKWQGLISKIEPNNQDSDLVYIELDRPDKKKPELIPDVVFVMDKKISNRLSELQFVVFLGYIDGIKKNTDGRILINIREAFLQGIMK